MLRSISIVLVVVSLVLVSLARSAHCFTIAISDNKKIQPSNVIAFSTAPGSNSNVDRNDFAPIFSSRRNWITQAATAAATGVLTCSSLCPPAVVHAEFTPGGTLVDRPVGVTVGNPEASPSRKIDNSNVLFALDYYFKFGTAAVWIEPDSTDFPKTMPFTRTQQRYDALKKYQDRVLSGIDRIKQLPKTQDITDPTGTDVYQIRPMGLLANACLASENTGNTNELFLARWYINEVYLLIGDMRMTEDQASRQRIYASIRKAINSYFAMLNRVITSKVGDKFEYV
jgi:hypothetical protein